MVQVEFKYKGVSTIIECGEKEIMKNTIKKFIQKAGINKNNNIYFLYDGNADIKTKEHLTFLEIANSVDKQQKKMTILVNDSNPKGKETALVIKSKYIICPICGENIKIKIKNFNISLYGCKNGHKMENLSLDEFNETQYIDLSKIKCSKCKKAKSSTFNNKFYKCSKCNINLCPLCKDKYGHKAIDYDEIKYKCIKHDDIYIRYCNTCKINICPTCEKEAHLNHDISSIDLKDKKDFEIELEKLRKDIDNINSTINKIIERLNNIKENLEKYYEFEKDMINNYEIQNYDILFNLDKIIKYNDIIKDINNKNKGKNISKICENLMDFYQEINNGNKIKLTLIIQENDINKNIYFLDNSNGLVYVNDKDENHYHDFLKELNESNAELFINNKKYKYQKYFKPDKEGVYSIVIKLKNNITDCSCMFCNCYHLINIDLSSLNTRNVIDMKNMFYDCSNLTNIDLSSFNTENVTNMHCMFYQCRNLTSIDLSYFNTKNVIDMRSMFFGCLNLSNIDLSSFQTQNLKSLKGIFNGCQNLKEIDLSSFNTENVTDMSFAFYTCFNLEYINLSSFNTENVTNMSFAFYYCQNLKNINLSSSFTIKNVTNKSSMFDCCSKLENIDLSLFNDKNIIIMKKKNDANISLLNESKTSNSNNKNNHIKQDSINYSSEGNYTNRNFINNSKKSNLIGRNNQIKHASTYYSTRKNNENCLCF